MGLFKKREGAAKHITAGSKTVVISRSTKSEAAPTVIHGVNTSAGNVEVFPCGSCATKYWHLYRNPR